MKERVLHFLDRQKPTSGTPQTHLPVSGDIQRRVIIGGTSRQHVEQQVVCTSIPPIKKLHTQGIHMSAPKKQNQASVPGWQAVSTPSPKQGHFSGVQSEFLEIPRGRHTPARFLRRKRWADVYFKSAHYRSAHDRENLKTISMFTIWLRKKVYQIQKAGVNTAWNMCKMECYTTLKIIQQKNMKLFGIRFITYLGEKAAQEYILCNPLTTRVCTYACFIQKCTYTCTCIHFLYKSDWKGSLGGSVG